MREDLADLWTYPADARVITTNGTVKANGRAVMGRGVAKQATERFAMIRLLLGQHLRARGNHVGILVAPATYQWLPEPIVSFPVKHQYFEMADLDLIARSATELVALTGEQGWRQVVLPRPGCNNGRRSWQREVRPILLPLLDDRFTVVVNVEPEEARS
jgi:hypothetical protein